jgi:sugar phosphate isomerase/epimerase
MHPRLCVHSVCFAGAGLPELSGYWRELGAHSVTLISSHLLETGGLAAAEEALESSGCAAEAIVHPFLGARPLEQREESWRDARETLSRLIQMAAQLDTRSIYMLTGGHGSATWEEAADAFSAAVAPCLSTAKAAGIELLVENSAPLYTDLHIAHTLRDTITLAETAGTGVCADLFACWAEAGLRDSIKRAMPRCKLVQVCDYVNGDRSLPSRAVPGDGAIPVKQILEWVLRAGYDGMFDIEIIGPRIDAEGRVKAVRRAADKVGDILNSLGCN